MKMKLNDLYTKLINDFELAGIESPSFEAKELIKHYAELDESSFLLNRNSEVEEKTLTSIIGAAEKREAGEPLQYILGRWDFLDNTFAVGNGVLIPRPETELLCEFVITDAGNRNNPVVYDLCSGSGCIGISVKNKLPEADVYCIEKSEPAFRYLLQNNKEICGSSAHTINADIFETEKFEALPLADVIVSNPPYIRTNELPYLQREVLREPEMALDGGEDGLIFYRFIISEWKRKLKNDGVFAFECGEDQADEIALLLAENGFKHQILKDYNNINRMVIGRRII